MASGKKLSIDSICLLILTTIALTASLMYLKSIMIPFVLSLFLYFMISPCVNHFENWFRMPRGPSVILTLFFGLAVIAVLVVIISSSLRNFIQSADSYGERISALALQVDQIASKNDIDLDMSLVTENLQAGKILSFVRSFTGEAFGILGNFFLIVVFLVFLLLGQTKAPEWPDFIVEIHHKVSTYVLTKFVTSTTTGLLVGLILKFIGVDLAFMFGMLAFLLNFIPSIGSVAATFLPVPIVLLQFGFGFNFALALIGPGLVQLVIGNFIEPKLMGDNLGLHPATLLFFLVFWGIVWGVPGMFLAVPITVIVKYIFAHFKGTEKLALVMEGRLD